MTARTHPASTDDGVVDRDVRATRDEQIDNGLGRGFAIGSSFESVHDCRGDVVGDAPKAAIGPSDDATGVKHARRCRDARSSNSPLGT
jgi:hypothetical protein